MRQGTLHQAVSYDIGRLYCGAVRDYLSEQRLRGRKIKWHEGSGVLERRFLIAGDPTDVSHVANVLNAWIRRLNEEDQTAAERGLARRQRTLTCRLCLFLGNIFNRSEQ